MNPCILQLCLSSLQTVNVKACFLHVQNNLIGKINTIKLIIVIEDIITIFMQFVMKGLIRRIIYNRDRADECGLSCQTADSRGISVFCRLWHGTGL